MVSSGHIKLSPKRLKINGGLKKAINALLPKINEMYPWFSNPRWLAMELLSGHERLSQELVWTNIAEHIEMEQIAESGAAA